MVRRDFGRWDFGIGWIFEEGFWQEGFWSGGILEEGFWLEGKGNITDFFSWSDIITLRMKKSL